MDQFETDQEAFWAGGFGNEYSERNRGWKAVASNTALFSKIFQKTHSISSVIEFGANIGLNLIAIQRLFREIDISAIEINPKAVDELKKIDNIHIYPISALNFTIDRFRDIVITKGFLIHVNPHKLDKIYDIIYKTSSKYVCIAEYYSPKPIEIEYRGHKEKLFKRDFAGEIMNKYRDLRLVDYGFAYHNDPNFPQDDITWFLLEKSCLHSSID